MSIPPIRILLVDDQALFREALGILFSVHAEFEVVAEAANGEEAIRMAAFHRPDIILMDLRMPLMDGVTATQRITASLPDCRVIILTTFDDDEYIYDGLRAGAVGYLMKDVSSDKLFEAIRSAIKGEYFLHPSITAKVVAKFSRLSPPSPGSMDPLLEALTPREIEILRAVATGASNREIAKIFIITEGTVKNHISNILSKMNVKDRMKAVIKARNLGIL